MLLTPLAQRLLACFATTACLAACGGGSESDTSTTTVTLYKHMSTMQCSGTGLTLSSMQHELLDAGVQVVRASCGSDGMMYPALCGSPDGRIGVFEIAASHAQAASARGFALMSNSPTAFSLPCPASDSPEPTPVI